MEVSHGPTLVDNNIMLSDRSVKYASQGAAFVHNLFAGSLTCVGTGTDNGAPDMKSSRYTPYHEIHGTKVAGFMSFLHGDVRFYNNIFVQLSVEKVFKDVQRATENSDDPNASMWDTMNFDVGTFVYDSYPTEAEWKKQFEGYCGMGSENPYPNRYYTHLPVWAEGNVYLGGAKPWKREMNPVVYDDFCPEIEIVETEDGLRLKTNIYEKIRNIRRGVVSTETLGMAFEPEERFENPDGSSIVFNMDYFEERRDINALPGPFADENELNENIW